jgi:hypothetical protein
MASAMKRRPISAAHQAAFDQAMGVAVAPQPNATGNQPAPIVVTLPPSAFQATWPKRPSEPVAIGLRLVSDSVNDLARAEATASADKFYQPISRDSDQYIEHWNGIAMRGILAEAVCQPHDVSASWFRTMAAEQVGVAFTDRGILRLWHGYDELRERLSPLLRVATAENIAELSTRLAATGVIERFGTGDRRILARLLDDLREQDVRSTS